MNSISKATTGKKSRANDRSLYMYSQTTNNVRQKKGSKHPKSQYRKSIRSFSNKKERIKANGLRINAKRSHMANLSATNHKYIKPYIVNMSDHIGRKLKAEGFGYRKNN